MHSSSAVPVIQDFRLEVSLKHGHRIGRPSATLAEFLGIRTAAMRQLYTGEAKIIHCICVCLGLQAMRAWTHRNMATSSVESGTACSELRNSAATPLFKTTAAPMQQLAEVGQPCYGTHIFAHSPDTEQSGGLQRLTAHVHWSREVWVYLLQDSMQQSSREKAASCART